MDKLYKLHAYKYTYNFDLFGKYTEQKLFCLKMPYAGCRPRRSYAKQIRIYLTVLEAISGHAQEPYRFSRLIIERSQTTNLVLLPEVAPQELEKKEERKPYWSTLAFWAKLIILHLHNLLKQDIELARKRVKIL